MILSQPVGTDKCAIEVLAIKPLQTAGNLRAFASIRIAGITVHDCRVVQQPGQRPWVSLPQREYVKDGQKKYSAIVELSDSLKREAERAILAAWEQGGQRT